MLGIRVRTALVALAVVVPSRAWADAAACITASDEGQRLRDLGSYAAARAAFAECAAETCPAIIRGACTVWLDELRASAPTVVFAARDDAGRDLVGVRVSVDGQDVAQADGRPIVVDPGSHTIRFVPAGHTPIDVPIVVRAGEKNRVVTAIFPTPAKTPSPPTEAGRSWLVPIVAGSLAAGFFAADAVLVGTATSDLHRLESSPCAATRTCGGDDVDSAKTRLAAGKVFLVLSVVSAAVLVVSLAWPRGPRPVLRGAF